MEWVGNKYIEISEEELNAVGGNLVIIDGGAAGEIFAPFNRYVNLCDIIRFEPRGDKYVLTVGNETSLPWALWSKRQKLDLKITKQNTCSSVFEPNNEINYLYSDEHAVNPRRVKKVTEVEATSIDEEITQQVDVIKLDVHGAELDALIGAKSTLKYTKFVLVETWTREVYRGQPLHHEVDEFLRNHGFEAVDMQIAAAWERNSNYTRNSIRRELIGLETLYINKNDLMRSNCFYKYALLLAIFGFTSYAVWLCENKEFQNKMALKDKILKAEKKHRVKSRLSLKFILQAIAARL